MPAIVHLARSCKEHRTGGLPNRTDSAAMLSVRARPANDVTPPIP